MKKLLLITILTLSFVLTSNAQDKASDLKTLFGLMNTEKMMDGMMGSILPMMKQRASENIKGDDAKEKFDKYIDFVTSETKEFTNRLINEEMVLIYDRHFTHQEVKDLIQFYESKTGEKMLEKTPEIMKDLMSTVMTKYMPDLQEKMMKKLEESK